MCGTGSGIILFACIYSISINTVVGFGESCTTYTKCTKNGEVCDTSNNTCACDTVNKYYYNGNQCDLDECSSNPCFHDGTCIDNVSSYTCNCVGGYTGTNCRTDIDECTTGANNCGTNTKCNNIDGSFMCSCNTGYTGNGVTCTDIDECTTNPRKCDTNTDCTNSVGSFTCSCKTGYSGDGVTCTDIDECTTNARNCDANADCTNTDGSFTCKCFTGYTGDGKTCTDINECMTNTDNCVANAYCSNTDGSFRCTCYTGYTGNGIICTDIDECRANADNCDAYAYCTNTDGSFRCTCNIGYTGDGKTCTDIDECKTNADNCDAYAYCTNTDGSFRCTCNIGYTGDGKTCTAINDCWPNPCLNRGTCKDMVNDFSCTCQEGFSSKTCSVAVLGAACGQTGTSCQDPNAVCQNKCVCKSFYYDSDGTSNIGGTCLQSKVLGKTCSSLPGECNTTHAQCLAGKCTCGSNYFDSNGFTDDGICYHTSNLRVKEINFPANTVTTSGFTVMWTAPDGNFAQYVKSYFIEWRLKTQDNSLNSGSKEVSSSMTSQVITAVTAGKAYTIKVTSKNTLTQSNNPRTTFLSKEQAAKPNTPGTINKSSSDLHVSAGVAGITLYWTRPSGGVSGYKLTLSDGTNTSSSESVSANHKFNPSWLKNGHRYNVTIQAKSETYEGGNVVLSEVYREEIKTVVTVPDAPRSVTCKDIFDQSIVLAWQIPSEPNGDLVRYTINVYDSNEMYLFNTSTTEVTYIHTIKNLKPGTPYTFRVYTENEKYKSTAFGEENCQTKARLSDPPSNLQVDNMLITSRNFTVLWDEPNNTYSLENYGYVIQVRLGEQCIKEVVYRCIDCRPESRPSSLENMCDTSIREVINIPKANLVGSQSWQVLSLLPDTTYIISATAVNSNGRGNVAKITQTTYEEVPQTPFSVDVSEITSTSFMVTWSINGDRPGKTNFTLYITADSPAPSKEITVTGFATRSKLVDNLEEFWKYVVSVKASTSKGSKTSSQTARQQTLPAAPGHVSGFQITNAPGGNYTQMKVTWKAPEILQRNSIIKEYNFEYYSDENSRFQQSLQQESTDTYEYTVFVDVRPEQTYTVQVFAVNEQNQKGNELEEARKAPAGVPINIEYTMHVNIISAYEMIDRRQGMFSVTIVPEFFEESTYGMIRATGLLACAKNCDFSRIKTLQDFNGLRNWKQASDDGFTLYRVTNPAWLLNLYAQITPCSGRRKRAVRSLIYTVGHDDCTDVASDEYCNGPLSPNTDFVLVAVSCTNGGCLLSKEYGPFSTIPAPISTVQDYNCTTQTVIVGVVLGLIIVILSVYAGYVTVLNRRYRRRKDYSQEHTAKKRNKKEQLYVNELMTARTASVEKLPSYPAMIREPESEYSRLDDATREEKSVYDIIHAL